MIGIVDYGAGNLKSVLKAFEHLSIPAKVITQPWEVEQISHLLLPGVGAFGKAMSALISKGFQPAIEAHYASAKPLLGICLGMQLLMSESTEMGHWKGLNFISGSVQKFDPDLGKVPLMGWNCLEDISDSSRLLKGISPGSYFYFVHSYYCCPEDEDSLAATASFGTLNYPAVIENNSLFAAQFHPEKSGQAGLQMLKNFASL